MTEDKKKAGVDLRQHYRIRYPIHERPVFECLGKKYPIIDISEKGLAIQIMRTDGIAQSKVDLTGRVAFKCGDIITISGKILRAAPDSVIIVLKQGVPFATVMKEQRLILQKYGSLGG